MLGCTIQVYSKFPLLKETINLFGLCKISSFSVITPCIKKKLRNTTWNILDNANAPDLHIYCGEARHSSGCELEFNFTWNLCQNTRLTIWDKADTSWIIEYLKFDQTWIYPVLFLTEWSRLFCWVVVLNLQAVRVYYVL